MFEAKHFGCTSLILLSSSSFVVMLKDDSELEHPQSEIRARQHWYKFLIIFLYCKGA